ncbi:hypothetical protein HYZ98_02035 [Candidatus Peregrinibacteria bacterium]|nr:hypothetical protein [Candidatus Peregrinibacteria bacterium]
MILHAAADFFKLPTAKRRAVMLKVAKDATEMQRDVLKKAERMKRTGKKGR